MCERIFKKIVSESSLSLSLHLHIMAKFGGFPSYWKPVFTQNGSADVLFHPTDQKLRKEETQPRNVVLKRSEKPVWSLLEWIRNTLSFELGHFYAQTLEFEWRDFLMHLKIKFGPIIHSGSSGLGSSSIAWMWIFICIQNWFWFNSM